MTNISEILNGYEQSKAMGERLKNKAQPALTKKQVTHNLINYNISEIAWEKREDRVQSDWLPDDVLNLIDDRNYLPKHKKIAREYGNKYLIKLSELAKTKNKPSHWYARATSKKNWKSITLPMLDKLFQAIESAEKAISKLGFSDKWLRFYIKVAFRTTPAKFYEILEQAQTTAKTTPQYYFRYLVSQV